MQAYDIIMIVVLLGATIWGYRKGLAWQIASLASILLSYTVAIRFRDVVAAQIAAEPPWNIFLAMLLLFIGTSLVIWILFRLIRGALDRAKLKEFDHHLGAIFGFAKGIVLSVIITLFAVTLLGETQRQTIIQSKSGFILAHILDRSHAIMPEEIHRVLEPYLHDFDQHLENPAGEMYVQPGSDRDPPRPWNEDGIPSEPDLAWPDWPDEDFPQQATGDRDRERRR